MCTLHQNIRSNENVYQQQYEHWVMAMHDELNQFKRNEIWEPVPRPSKTNIIGTKWVFKNRLNDMA